jgi:hypothetical protein
VENPVGKTKFQAYGPAAALAPTTIDINDGKIERETQFVYLGAVFDEDGSDEHDIENRIKKAERRLHAIDNLFSARADDIPPSLKFKALKAFVLPIVSYGCEAWAPGHKGFKLMDVFWMKCLRRCRSISLYDHVTNDDSLKFFKTCPLSVIVSQRRLKYLGHILRYPADRWVRKSIISTRPGKSTDGRKLCWKNDVLRTLHTKQVGLADCLFRERWVNITWSRPVPQWNCTKPPSDEAPITTMRDEQRGRRRLAAIRAERMIF